MAKAIFLSGGFYQKTRTEMIQDMQLYIYA